MMQIRQLARLRELAELKKEVELSRLSRVVAAKTALDRQEQALQQAEQAARHEGLASHLAGQMAETFAIWTLRRREEVARDLAALAPLIAAQRAIAAQALGRTDVLQQLESRQKLAAPGRRPKG